MSQTPVAKKETKETVDPKDQREIYLAGGCFWGVEEYFSRVPGVIDAVSGYANGKGETTKYELVPQTGHAETVHITYNVKKVSLKELFCIISGLSTQRRRIDKEMIKEHNTEQVSIMFPKKTFQPLIKSLKKKQKIRQTVSSGKRATDQFHQG